MSSIINAFKGLKRNFSMSSASIVLVLLTLLVMGSVLIIGLNGNKISRNIVDSITLYAYIDKEATEEQTKDAIEQIEKIENVDGVTFSTSDEELSDLSNIFGDDSDEILENFSGEDNPLYPTFEISISETVDDLDPIINELDDIDIILDVNQSNSDALENLVSVITAVQFVGIALAAVLFAISLFIITNTIRLAITARRKEIEIMRLVGATKHYIRSPFLYEGGIIGFIGGLISATILSFGYYELYGSNSVMTFRSSLVEPLLVIEFLYLILILSGIIIGVIGSAIALRRHLKR